MRVGLGYDAHRLVAGRPLILGGVEIPHALGLLGHSDADVLAHAIGDALLGAVGAGDLGTHFPDKDPAYKNISSLILLQRIMHIVRDRGFAPANVDATLVAQEPRLAPHIPAMQANLAPILGLTPDAVNVKATTTELMGFTGRGEGIAAYAVVLVTKT
jgi:2-C-methyl-D-erythritol 2,4-cyclodiphosphate synthase